MSHFSHAIGTWVLVGVLMLTSVLPATADIHLHVRLCGADDGHVAFSVVGDHGEHSGGHHGHKHSHHDDTGDTVLAPSNGCVPWVDLFPSIGSQFTTSGVEQVRIHSVALPASTPATDERPWPPAGAVIPIAPVQPQAAAGTALALLRSVILRL